MKNSESHNVSSTGVATPIKRIVSKRKGKDGLTISERRLAKLLLANPDMTDKEAGLTVFNTTNPEHARQTALQTRNRPAVMAYMEAHGGLAEKTAVEVLRNARKRKDKLGWQRLAADQSERILDRLHGKPTQRTEVNGRVLNVTIDLSGNE